MFHLSLSHVSAYQAQEVRGHQCLSLHSQATLLLSTIAGFCGVSSLVFLSFPHLYLCLSVSLPPLRPFPSPSGGQMTINRHFSSTIHLLGGRSLTCLELAKRLGLLPSKPLRSACLCLFSTRISNFRATPSLFHVGSGKHTPVAMCSRQMFCPLSHPTILWVSCHKACLICPIHLFLLSVLPRLLLISSHMIGKAPSRLQASHLSHPID